MIELHKTKCSEEFIYFLISLNIPEIFQSVFPFFFPLNFIWYEEKYGSHCSAFQASKMLFCYFIMSLLCLLENCKAM